MQRRSINPAFTDRLAELSRPRWARTATARRVVAGLLAALAVALYLRGDPDSERVAVIVAGRDLQPGRIIAADDLRQITREAGSLPDGVIVDADRIVGRTLAGPTRAGEPITDVRVLGPRLAAAATGADDARVVPIRLADAGVAELLREGDRVDVLMAAEESARGSAPSAGLLAADAAAVLVSSADSGRGSKERVVMLALPAGGAAKVAAASLNSALTVIFH